MKQFLSAMVAIKLMLMLLLALAACNGLNSADDPAIITDDGFEHEYEHEYELENNHENGYEYIATEPQPKPYQSMRGPIIGVAAGWEFSLAIMYDGSLWEWGVDWQWPHGYNSITWWNYYPTRILEDVVFVTAEGGRPYAITADGGLWAWGGHFRINRGEAEGSPVRIMDNVADVAASFEHTMVVTNDGGLWVWGRNTWGGLGVSGLQEQGYPLRIMDNVASVAVGRTSMALKQDGSLWIWGDVGLSFPEIAPSPDNIIETPTHIMDNIVAIAAADSHIAEFLALTDDGRVWMWDWGGAPALMGIPERIVAIESAQGTSWAISESNNLWGWMTMPASQSAFADFVDDWAVWDEFVEKYELAEDGIDNFTLRGMLSEEYPFAFSDFLMARIFVALDEARTPSLIKENVSFVSFSGHHTLVVTTDGNLWIMGGTQLLWFPHLATDYDLGFVNVTAAATDVD